MLLVGDKRSQTPPDASHPFGYGPEIYFWTFVVAILVLIAGAGASVFEGIRQLRNPEPVSAPFVSLGVLALSAVFEGTTFLIGYSQSRRVGRSHKPGGKYVGVWSFIKISKDPNLYETLLEDGAALIGIAIAVAGIAGSAFLHLLWADGVASIAIGVLLLATSLMILRATRSLMGGEAAAPPSRQDIERALHGAPRSLSIADVLTLHLGPRTVLVSLTLRPPPKQDVQHLKGDLEAVRRILKSVDPRIRHILFQFSDERHGGGQGS